MESNIFDAQGKAVEILQKYFLFKGNIPLFFVRKESEFKDFRKCNKKDWHVTR